MDQMLNHGRENTFLGYAEQVFLHYAPVQLERTTHVQIVWDVYQTYSLRGTARQKAAKIMRDVPCASIPKDWTDVLRVRKLDRTVCRHFGCRHVYGCKHYYDCLTNLN